MSETEEHVEPKKASGADTPSREQVAAFEKKIVALLKQRGVEVTPIVETRAKDMATWWWLAQHYEAVLRDSESGTSSAGAGQTGWKPHPSVDALAKTWERLRRAMKELEDMCGQESATPRGGLASRMKPIIEKTQGVLEDAIEFERKKRERAARKLKAQESKGESR